MFMFLWSIGGLHRTVGERCGSGRSRSGAKVRVWQLGLEQSGSVPRKVSEYPISPSALEPQQALQHHRVMI